MILIRGENDTFDQRLPQRLGNFISVPVNVKFVERYKNWGEKEKCVAAVRIFADASLELEILMYTGTRKDDSLHAKIEEDAYASGEGEKK